jgi:hypothetical protein
VRRLLAVSVMAVTLSVGACGSDDPPAQPTGFVTDDQVEASDATSSSIAGSGSSTTEAEALTFCEAWAASRALEEGSTGGQPDFERMQRSIVAVRDTAPAALRGELEGLLSDLERLRVIGQRYSWRFDDSTKVSDEDAAAIKEITDTISGFGTASKVARAAAKQCG